MVIGSDSAAFCGGHLGFMISPPQRIRWPAALTSIRLRARLTGLEERLVGLWALSNWAAFVWAGVMGLGALINFLILSSCDWV